ncbi:phage tail tape measure protein [Hymenobacter sp. BT664]|uniref:Phage tail tape measure protein n=1 Tax=Hymenobacter montanus TaxID=2771359 RepID=A0A927BF28_9BACT|nr:phage tail tape measure protein [Hymenobacter montanus]MBD2769701.1 phage tail tape measure protein [Hymenobacter montanus]
MKNYQWVLNLVDKVSGPMQQILQRGEKVSGVLDKAKASAKSMFLNMAVAGQVAQGFTTINNAITSAVEPGVKFEQTLAELSALTGTTGAALDAMGQSARNTASIFGGPVSGYVTSATNILGELGPQLAKNQAAMDSMTTSVAILSKSMGGDAVGATAALTASMQQFGVDTNNPVLTAKAMTTAMNVMASAANAGAAQVPQITQSLASAGVAASNARVSFYETNAAIQVLAAGQKKGAEAGVGLRNVLGKLSEGRFLPKETRMELKAAGVDINVLANKSLTLGQRLTELKKIQKDGALVTKFFGVENDAVGNILLRGVDKMAQFESQIRGTNGAVDAAKIVMNSYAARMDRMKAMWENLGIEVFNATKPYLPYIQTAGQAAAVMSQSLPILEIMKNGLVHAASAVWDFGLGLAKGALAVLQFGARMLLVAAQGIGSFILSMGRGIISIFTFGTSIRLQAALALGIFQNRLKAFSMQGFLTSMWQGSVAALRAGASWLWAAVTGLPALIAGFVTTTAAQWALNVAMNANPIGAIILGIMALAGAVYLIIRNWDVVKGWLLALGNFFIKYNPFTMMVQGIFKLFPGIEAWFRSLWDKITGFVHQLVGKIKFLWDKIAPYLGFGEMKMGGDIESKLIIAGKNEDPFAAGQTAIGAAGNGKLKASVDKVASGGSKPTTINIHIGKFQDSVNFYTTNIKEGVNDAMTMLEEGLTRVVNGVSQGTGA